MYEEELDDWEEEEEPVEWDAFDKDTYIDTVKFAYQNPAALIDQDYEPRRYNYDDTDWKTLFGKYSAEDWICMDEEKALYDSLPEEVEVYRGGTSENGISWTLSRRVATWFATQSMQYRNCDNCRVFSKTVKKSDIRAVLLDMDEFEVIIL